MSYIIAKQSAPTLRFQRVGMKYFGAALPFLLITILRFDVGTDYMQYLWGYYNYGIGESRGKEIAFQFLVDLSHDLNFPFLMITLFGTLVCVLTFLSIYKQSYNIKQSIVLFFLSGYFIYSLTMMRQSAVTALFFVEIMLLLRGKTITALCFSIIGALLHSTGYVYLGLCLVFIVLYRYHYFDKLLHPYILVAIAGVAISFGALLREHLQLITESAETYSGYFGSDQDLQNSSGTFLLYGITPFISFFLIMKDKGTRLSALYNDRLEYIIFTVCCWLSLVCGLLRPLIPNGERIVFLFEPICILSIPFFCQYSSTKKKFVYNISCLCLAACTFWYFYVRQSLNMFPYHFIFLPDVNIW